MFSVQKSKQNDSFREIKNSYVYSKFINWQNKQLLNLGSNDYLAIATNLELRDEFLEICKQDSNLFFGSGASRLVYSSSDEFSKLEAWFQSKFNGKKALIFNSGYCANLSTINALADEKTMFLADKLVHASMIDGLRGGANFKRYSHNDYEMLENLLDQNCCKYEKIIILTESIFSMDGDSADLQAIANLKKKYKNTMLYVDEAHSFFAINKLGSVAKAGLVKDFDFILITLGKAVGSSAAVILCDENFYDLLVNSARSLIYSTAIPPINIAWTNFVLNKNFDKQRENLQKNIEFFNHDSHILPFILSDNKKALALSKTLFEAGYFVPAIRPPTVPTARLRISLRADIKIKEIEGLKKILDENKIFNKQ